MREINNGDLIIGVKASPLTLLFYKQQFKSDLLSDLIRMKRGERVDLDTVAILQIGWALNKTYHYPKGIVSFMTWMENLGSIDAELLKGIMEEAGELFVKDNGSTPSKKKRK